MNLQQVVVRDTLIFLANYITVDEKAYYNRVSELPSFMCSLFQKATFRFLFCFCTVSLSCASFSE